jgi:hypothetical protein
MQVSPPQDAAAELFANVAQRALLCSALLRCFAFDRAAAPLLLYSAAAAPEGGGRYGGATLPLSASALPSADGWRAAAEGGDKLPHGRADHAAEVTAGADNGGAALTASLKDSVDYTADASAANDGAPARAGAATRASAVLLPRMPAGLLYVASPRAYDALARIPRTLGRLAAAADAANPGEELCSTSGMLATVYKP